MKTIACVMALGLVGVALGDIVKVSVESTPVKFDAPPQMIRGVTMVPVRNIVDAMKGTMRWDLERRLVTVWCSRRRYDMLLDVREARVNGKTVMMEEAAYMNQGRLYVPLKFVAEASGYVVSFEKGIHVLRQVRP